MAAGEYWVRRGNDDGGGHITKKSRYGRRIGYDDATANERIRRAGRDRNDQSDWNRLEIQTLGGDPDRDVRTDGKIYRTGGADGGSAMDGQRRSWYEAT